MRSVGISAVLLFASVAAGADAPPREKGTAAVDDSPRASGTLHGKPVRFPRETVPDGVKAVLGLLGSCHHAEKDCSRDDWKKSQKGDHVHLTLAKPQRCTVLDEEVPVSELVVTLPLNTGVIWVRSGGKVSRFAKYEFAKERALTDWLRQARPAR